MRDSVRSGRAAYLHDCCNVIATRGLGVRRVEKRVPASPALYAEYADFSRRLRDSAPHTEAIKQGVLAGLGVAFLSIYAIQAMAYKESGRPAACRRSGSEASGSSPTSTLSITNSAG
jgi:hypothetical protein